MAVTLNIKGTTLEYFKLGKNVILNSNSQGGLGIGVVPSQNMKGLAVEGGTLTFKEITNSPESDLGYAKLYSKTDKKLYFQDGNGGEKCVYPQGGSNLVSTRYNFSESLLWLVQHNMNTTRFSETLTDEEGNRFFAKTKIVDENSFEIQLTASTGGFVDVIFMI